MRECRAKRDISAKIGAENLFKPKKTNNSSERKKREVRGMMWPMSMLAFYEYMLTRERKKKVRKPIPNEFEYLERPL